MSGLFGMSGSAAMRAADAMLRSLGGDCISLVFAAAGFTNDPSAQLGMVDPGVEEVQIRPVVAKSVPTAGTGPRVRREFLLPGSVVARVVVTRNAASAEAMFESALGVMHAGLLLHIESVTTEFFAGAAYLYRVAAVE